MSEKPRLWGIDVIGVVYALATLLLLFALSMAGNTLARAGICVALLLTVVFTIGMFARIEGIRVLMTVLLTIAIVGDLLMGVFYIAALLEVVRTPPNLEPLNKLKGLPMRIGLTVWMLMYLRRSDVKKAFHVVDLNAHHETPDEPNT